MSEAPDVTLAGARAHVAISVRRDARCYFWMQRLFGNVPACALYSALPLLERTNGGTLLFLISEAVLTKVKSQSTHHT